MKKVILNLDEDGSLYDNEGTMIMDTTGMNYVLSVFDPPTTEPPEEPKQSLTELIELGVSIDNITKLRLNNII